jgi:CDP-glucose 4,6-dehydratase
MNRYNNVFSGKTVLVTGHTGFKGSWLSIWLHELGANVVGYSLNPYTNNDNFVLSGIGSKIIDIRADIRDKNKLHEVFSQYKPEFVFHLAAQPLVRLSYEKPFETYEINVMGSINILEEIRNCSETKVVIMVTSDKCYENKEQIWGYNEADPMGGYDPYSSSKGAVEIAINSWRRSFFNPDKYSAHGKSIASVRAGNVIGGGDWAIDRIIPDCIKAIENQNMIDIRSPHAIRPWQHVLEPLNGYLMLASKMYTDPISYSQAWNFGPEASSMVTVWEIASEIVHLYGSGRMRDVSNDFIPHEAKLLLLDTNKARFHLGWKPVLNIADTLKFTVDWYKKYKDEHVYMLCVNQIIEFCSIEFNSK